MGGVRRADHQRHGIPFGDISDNDCLADVIATLVRGNKKSPRGQAVGDGEG